MPKKEGRQDIREGDDLVVEKGVKEEEEDQDAEDVNENIAQKRDGDNERI